MDLRSGEVHKHGLRIKLHDQPFLVLAMLLEHPGELVTREQLRERLWPADTFVDFDVGLNSAIKRLRDALGDSAENPRFVETLPRRGYRFVFPVNRDSAAGRDAGVPSAAVFTRPRVESSEAASITEAWPRLDQVGRRPRWVAVAVLICLIVLLGAYLVARNRRAVTAGAGVHSIAVLPLENLSADPQQEYFADGMTDELITNLAKLGGLRVISRSSVMRYKRARKSVAEIGHELNVDAVVEGTVARSGSSVRITAQLIRTASDQHLWADEFQGEMRDVLTLQSEVARAIATQIRVNLRPQQLASPQTINPQAYEYYLKGRYNFWERWSKEGNNNAIQYFEMAIEKDPHYAAPFAGLAQCYALGFFQGQELTPREAWSKAATAAKTALELDDQRADAHIAMANVRFRFDWNWAEAEREFKRALELSPNDALGHSEYSIFLGLMARPDEAIAEAMRARELDPLSPHVSSGVNWVHQWSRHWDDAIAESRRTLQLDPNFLYAHAALAWSYENKEMYAQAVSEWLKWHALNGDSPEQVESLRKAFATSGIRGFWRKTLEWLKQLNQPPYFEIAKTCVHLDRIDEAFFWLEKAYDARFPTMPNIKVEAWLDPVRSDPRYADLLRRVGLPP